MLLNGFPEITVKSLIDIAIVAFLIYRLLLYLSKTRAMQILWGVVGLILLAAFAKLFKLYTLSFILNSLLAIGIFALIVIFQPEIRKLLAKLGEKQFGVFGVGREIERSIDETVRACARLSEDKIGALIVFEREVDTDGYTEAGTLLDANVSKELIITIFWPGTPLHDGAVIIRSDRLYKAGVFLPLSLNPKLPQSLGTRHRAAIGITEETDAIAVVISEETGDISVAYSGKLIKSMDLKKLRNLLRSFLVKEEEKKHWLKMLYDLLKGEGIEKIS